MEPLILPGAELRRPVFAAYAKGGRRLHVGMQEMGGDSLHRSVAVCAARQPVDLLPLKLARSTPAMASPCQYQSADATCTRQMLGVTHLQTFMG